MVLEDRLAKALGPRKPVSKRMFGGTCFMLNGNMVIGTFRGGLIVRVGDVQYANALMLPGAKPFEMNGRVSKGFVTVDAESVAVENALSKWLKMALAFNATLPAKAAKPMKKSKKA